MRYGNNRKSYVETDILGDKVLLKFDFNAVAELEEYFDKGISTIFSSEQVGFRTIRAFYWIGMRWNMRNLTIEAVGDMIGDAITHGLSFEELMGPISDGMRASGIIKSVDVEATVIEAEGETSVVPKN